jgi:AGZA family xanthine/uracil permease-like MFS transporter
VAGDLNAFFGLFTNVLLNVLVLSGLALFVVQMPADTVYGRILPALGIALPLGNLFYAITTRPLAPWRASSARRCRYGSCET